MWGPVALINTMYPTWSALDSLPHDSDYWIHFLLSFHK